MLRDFCRLRIAIKSITRTLCREEKRKHMFLFHSAIMENESTNVIIHAKRSIGTVTDYNNNNNSNLDDDDNYQRSEAVNSKTITIKSTSRRMSQRRHSRDNTCGRGEHAQELVKEMKCMTKLNAKNFFDQLMPRDKLDVLRYLAHRSQSRHKQSINANNNNSNNNGGSCDYVLPRYMSKHFKRKYYFKEEDLEEMTTLGHGPGGQATNRRRQSVIVRHIPTNTIVKYSHFTSLQRNRTFAREKLNLLVEEKLLGANSQLGRLKLRQHERQRARQAEIARYCAEGIECNARLSQQRQYYAFLTNQISLPSLVLCELRGALQRKELRINNLFNEECHNLWQLLLSSFAHANKPSHLDNNPKNLENAVEKSEINTNAATTENTRNDNNIICENKSLFSIAECNDDHSITDNCKNENINKNVKMLHVPEFVRYLFPLTEQRWQKIVKEHEADEESVQSKLKQELKETERWQPEQQEREEMALCNSEEPFVDNENVQKSDEWEKEEVEKCARDEVAMANVQRMLRCIAEVFGLYLREVHKTDNHIKWVLSTDGINWVEMRHRMYTSSNNTLTPIAQTFWPWIYYSLRQLHLNAEADAVRVFFKRQHRLLLQKQEQHQQHLHQQQLTEKSANWTKQMMYML